MVEEKLLCHSLSDLYGGAQGSRSAFEADVRGFETLPPCQPETETPDPEGSNVNGRGRTRKGAAASPRETGEFPAPRYALAGGVLWVTRRVRGLVSKTGCLLSSILRSPARPNALVGLHREWFTICLSSKPSRFESGM